MRRLRRGSCSWACSALLVALAALVLAATPGRAATDDQNLTGLVYLADESPLSAAAWANNTSFAVYVNHNGSWSTAWRYPAWPAWYLTSAGAYSIVLPAAQKDVKWSNGDPYLVEFDASTISGVQGTVDNATSHGTGDPGEFSMSGATENAIVWSSRDNWQRWDVVVLARPDYVPAQPQPGASARTALSSPLDFSVQVLNRGNTTAATASTLALYNASTPAAPFATFAVPPLSPSETSARFTASWTSPSAPGAVQVVAEVDYRSELVEGDETNNEYTWTVDVLAGPITDLVLGQPSVNAALAYVTSATTLSFRVVDQSGTGIRNTTYRVDGGGWVNYTASGPFSLVGEGAHRVEWSSTDFAGNVEAIANASLRVDDTPPTTLLSVGDPKSAVGGTFVNESTPLALAATDGGVTPVGTDFPSLRLWNGAWSAWAVYGSPFTLAGVDGVRYVEYRSQDLLGNQEAFRNETLVLDDTPPTTTLSPETGPFTPTTSFTSFAMDAGSGVSGTEVRIDGGAWSPYTTGFMMAAGDHNVSYRSVDRLGNREQERTRAVHVQGPPQPPPPEAANLKPFIAAAFGAVLLLVGGWSARRAPWPTGSRRRLRAFALAAMPFVAVESATGLVSLLTGLLVIPPLLGAGTAIDLGILVAGILVSAYRVRAGKPAA